MSNWRQLDARDANFVAAVEAAAKDGDKGAQEKLKELKPKAEPKVK